MVSDAKTPKTFQQPWFSNIQGNSRVYTPLKQNHFIFQIGGIGDGTGVDQCATGFSMIDARDSSCPQTDAYDPTNGGIIWYAKSVTKPTITFEKAQGDLLDGLELAPSAKKISKSSLMLSPISLTLIDPSYPNATRRLLRILRRSGLYDKTISGLPTKGGEPEALDGVFNSSLHTAILGNARLFQYTHDPDSKDGRLFVSEAWTFYGCHMLKIDFGKLDYSSNDLVELNIDLGYVTFDVETPSFAGEIEFKYGRDARDIAKMVAEGEPAIPAPAPNPTPPSAPGSGGLTPT